MTLIDQLEREGNWLFRWRSYLPVIFIPFIAIALVNQTRWPLGSEAMQSAWQVICLSVSVLGLAIRVIAVGHAPANTSGRNTESQLAQLANPRLGRISIRGAAA